MPLVCRLFLVLLLLSAFDYALSKNGFDVSNTSIPLKEILHGGPPKDGIPAINSPLFLKANQQKLNDSDRVIGIYRNGIAKAYPIRILNWHEIVNDQFNNEKVVISYCPLCGTGIAFLANIDKQDYEFGVSGLLYNSDVLLYDRQTESLWSQIIGAAISGKLKGQRLQQMPLQHTSWKAWKQQYPTTLVLSENTGFKRDYQRDPYQGYAESRRIFFQTSHQAPEIYHPKEPVLGIEVNGVYKAYPYLELRKQARPEFVDEVNGRTVTIKWDAEANSAYVLNEKGQPLPATIGFWFAWFTFHPQTQLFSQP